MTLLQDMQKEIETDGKKEEEAYDKSGRRAEDMDTEGAEAVVCQ